MTMERFCLRPVEARSMQNSNHREPEGRSVFDILRKEMSEAESVLIRAFPALPNIPRRPAS